MHVEEVWVGTVCCLRLECRSAGRSGVGICMSDAIYAVLGMEDHARVASSVLAVEVAGVRGHRPRGTRGKTI